MHGCLGLYRSGTEKRGGRLLLNSHVAQVVMEGGRAVGVELRGGGTIRARKVRQLPHHPPPAYLPAQERLWACQKKGF